MLTIKKFTFNLFSQNTYIAYDQTKQCALIDAGCHSKEECMELSKYIEDNKLTVSNILLTHCHIDHVLGLNYLQEKYKLQGFMHRDELEQLNAVPLYAPMWGVHDFHIATSPTVFIQDYETVKVGDTTYQCILAPGHSPASICFYSEQHKILFGGDVLFRESIGRTDLPGGNYAQLEHSIKTRIYSLPEDVTVYAGHMEETTIGYEKMNNPFVQGNR
ncbi:MAG: MBL fold metallo-hydrolase [Bacteroidetes bacterium]|nr:MBL fold metallo-hydrolase [Bacteroidota bacterium]